MSKTLEELFQEYNRLRAVEREALARFNQATHCEEITPEGNLRWCATLREYVKARNELIVVDIRIGEAQSLQRQRARWLNEMEPVEL